MVASLGVLGWFKYADFFVDEPERRCSRRSASASPVAATCCCPAGISFYTFKTMSYTIDVYRRELAPARSLMHYATFVTFFPELIAGPIVRASVFLPQMGREIGPTRGATARRREHLPARPDQEAADRRPARARRRSDLRAPAALRAGHALDGRRSPTPLQIYCDFSGYSDMAIGVAKMIGYDLPRNFRMPYLSASIAEFWRRWHITLSTWLRDYLYIPLGGNRQGRARAPTSNLAAHDAARRALARRELELRARGAACTARRSPLHRAVSEWRGDRRGAADSARDPADVPVRDALLGSVPRTRLRDDARRCSSACSRRGRGRALGAYLARTGAGAGRRRPRSRRALRCGRRAAAWREPRRPLAPRASARSSSRDPISGWYRPPRRRAASAARSSSPPGCSALYFFALRGHEPLHLLPVLRTASG